MEEASKSIRVIRELKQVMSAVKQNMHQEFKEMNLTGPQGMTIGILAHFGEMKISDLSQKMGLSNSTVSGIIDRLEKQGFVERIRSREDRRVIFVCLTAEFKKHAEEHFREVEEKLESVMEKATPEELDKILEGLGILKRLMDESKKD